MSINFVMSKQLHVAASCMATGPCLQRCLQILNATACLASGTAADHDAHRVDEVASEVAHKDAGGQQSILEGERIDLERHIVDVYEVDTKGGGHADAARAEAGLHVPTARPGDEGDVALDGLHLQPLKVPLAATPGVGGLGGLQRCSKQVLRSSHMSVNLWFQAIQCQLEISSPGAGQKAAVTSLTAQ